MLKVDAHFLYNQYIKLNPQHAQAVRDSLSWYYLFPIDISKKRVWEHCIIIAKYVSQLFSLAYPIAQSGQTKLTLQKSQFDTIVTELCEENINVKKLTHVFLKIVLGVQSNVLNLDDDTTLHLNWNGNNEFLNSRPVWKDHNDIHATQRITFFENFFQNPSLADITFEVEGEKFPAHKVILAQCPFLNEMFLGQWKENKIEIVPIKECKSDTFSNFLEYLYKQKVSKDYFNDIHNCLDMFLFADRMRFEPLKGMAKNYIFELFSEGCFIEIVLFQCVAEDKDLELLCQWFVKANPSYGENLDLSKLDILSLVKVCQVGKKYKLEALIKETSKTIIAKLKLDEKFISVCNLICEKKDVDLKKVVVEAIKTNKNLFTAMEDGKKGDYKDYWKAYKKMITSIDLL